MKSDLASHLCVPYSLLEACNPDELEHPKKGQTISLGNNILQQAQSHSMSSFPATCATVQAAFTGVQAGDTFWTISRLLATFEQKDSI